MTAIGTRPSTDVDRAFWREVLLAGGATALPRWAPHPVPGTAEVEVSLPAVTLVALRRLADRLAVPLGSVLLAGHVRVLAALTGEPDVVTGYVAADGGTPLPCRLRVDAGSWRQLVRAAATTESGLLAHRHADLSALRRELGTSGPSSEAVFDPTGAGGELPGGAVLAIVPVHRGERLTLRLRYRTDAFDAEAAARIGGYHRTALDELVADPDADPMTAVLLSAEELVLQIDGLAGPHRELPDRRVHQLIEEQARRHPDDVAAVHGEEQISYGELDGRANQVARALLARGLQPEDVVAVVTERDLDWLTAVLAVFKAGGAYLPLEPHFPADRIARVLTRAECRLALTEPGSTASLDDALTGLPGVQALAVGDAAAEGHPATAPGVQVGPDQLAYLYFTSGSTGEPKGAMCEHAGMLNHVLAKIDDLGIAEGRVVAQVAPQCFDISLWQLVSALVVGGRTVLVPQDVVLDAERFVDRLVDEHVAVVQVVPSYLEVVLTYLEAHPRTLPDLRCVSVTGEAVKKELVQRWFAAQPGIALVNAYGLTETSDDTNHAVLRAVPDTDRVPLGRPIANVEVRVVDEHLVPVPLGAPGEIAFSGVCVGRGYVNDPERTRAAFVPDPYRPGRRLYRSGDSGRWLPGGELDFLGRRDSQVKISGFRIEIGEIENTLLRVPGVRDGAVVVAEGPDRTRHLVAFWTGAEPIPDDVLRNTLAGSLPAYMVPRAFHRQPALPLTPNGKVDTKALTALAGELLTGSQDHDAPTTPSERRLADVWSTVLGVPADQIGRRDSFAALGGTSLSAVKLLVALGRAVSLKELQAAPDLAALAALLDERAGVSSVPSPRTPEGSAS
ncbi:non-ribosomal peptide synthetase [Geodermatophilus sp. URMC 60]